MRIEKKLSRTVRACLNTDLRESFKEVVADGDSVLTFASHSTLIVDSRTREQLYIPGSSAAAAVSRENTG